MQNECTNVSLNNHIYRNVKILDCKEDLSVIHFVDEDGVEVLAKVDNIILEKIKKNS